jgi:hypothetical protein
VILGRSGLASGWSVLLLALVAGFVLLFGHDGLPQSGRLQERELL